MGVPSSEGRRKGAASKVKKQINSIMYDRLFSIYLTPKAFDDIRIKSEHFAKIINETKK